MNRLPLFLLIPLFLLFACQAEQSSPTPTATPITTPTLLPTATIDIPPTPTLRPTKTPSPTALPITEIGRLIGNNITIQSISAPELIVNDQAIEGSRRFIVNKLSISQPVYLAVTSKTELLGVSKVEPGEYAPYIFGLDQLPTTAAVTVTLYFADSTPFDLATSSPILRKEAGQDEWVAITQQIELTLRYQIPSIESSSQTVTSDGLISIEKVVGISNGWLVAHADESGIPTTILGYMPIYTGENEPISLRINLAKATNQIHLILYEDLGEIGRFDPLDQPLLFQGEQVEQIISLTLPPSLIIYDQPIVAEQLLVERVVSPQKGWLVVYQDAGSQLGALIGRIPLQAGVQTDLQIPIDQEKVTDILYIRLHEDTGQIGGFDFPAADPPIQLDESTAVFTIKTNPSSYLLTQDQIAKPTIIIPLAVVYDTSWIIIRTGSIAEPGSIIGQINIPAGLNKNISISISSTAKQTVYAQLYADRGLLGTFEEDSADFPIQWGGESIIAPFTLK